MIPVIALAAAATLLIGAAPDVYLLAGQSNMSDRGAITDLPAKDRIVDQRVRLYGTDGGWHHALDPLDDATDQVDAVSANKEAAVGPGLSFARTMLRSAVALSRSCPAPRAARRSGGGRLPWIGRHCTAHASRASAKRVDTSQACSGTKASPMRKSRQPTPSARLLLSGRWPRLSATASASRTCRS